MLGIVQQLNALQFGSAGIGDVRSSYDSVRAGDVIRAQIPVGGAVFDSLDEQYAKLWRSIAGIFTVRAVTRPGSYFGAGYLVIEVQARSDFSSINDVSDILAHLVYEAGIDLYWSGRTVEFISKVEQTGGMPQPQIPSPFQNNSNSGGQFLDSVNKFFENLATSPTTLAVIVGGIVVLVIAAKD